MCGMFETNPKLGNKKWCLWNVKTNLKLDNKPNILKQQMWVLSIEVCVWNVRNKPKIQKQKRCGGHGASWCVCVCVCVKCSKQTQNSKTKNRGVGVEHRGVCSKCLKQTQNLETKLRQMEYRGNRHRWYIVNIIFLNYLMHK